MYEINAQLKNVNLRNELAGEDQHVGAFDLKFELPFTAELHKLLCKNINKPINLLALQDCGLTGVDYSTEAEDISVQYLDYRINGAKLNNAKMKLGTTNTGSIRIQAQIGDQHGVVERLNDLVGEPVLLQIDEESLSVVIVEAQEDLFADNDQTQAVASKPAAENRSPSGKKPATKKKVSVKKSSVKKSANDDATGLHVVGGEQVKMTAEQKAAAEEEKKALAARVKTNKKSSNAGEEVSQALDMVLELEDAKMGQGDRKDFDDMKVRLDAGKALNQTQTENLNDLYNRYAA